MTELKELEEGLRNLKKDNQEKKRLLTELENEKNYLEERNRYLIEKLKQAGILYEESGRRLIDFVDQNIKPVRAKLDEFEVRLHKIKEYDVSINSALKKVDDFNVIVGNFKNEMVKNSEKQAAMMATMGEFKKAVADMAKRISTVQTFGSEELAEKVEEIKAKFGEDVRKIEDQFSVLKIGVGNSIDNFKKEFERQANALRNEMEKVDIKKAKELGEALAHVTEELDKTKVDFSKAIASMERIVERLDVKKTKEMNQALETLSANLEDKFSSLAADVDKKVIVAEEHLNRFRVELEKTLSKAKVDTRDFVATKSKEFDTLLAELKEKMNAQLQASASEWDKKLGSLRTEIVALKSDVEKLIATINRKVEIGEERREKRIDSEMARLNSALNKKLENTTDDIYAHVAEVSGDVEELKANLGKKIMDAESELTRFRVELEKTLGKAKVDTRDFMVSKSKEFDAVLAGMKDKVDKQVLDSANVWDKNLGSLRTDLITTKEEVEKLVATINRKVEAGEERREKKLDASLTRINASLGKRLEAEAEKLYEQITGINEDIDGLKANLAKSIDMLNRSAETGETKRKAEISGIIKEFMAVKGQVDEKINEVSAELEKFSHASETLRKQITKESLAGVQEKLKMIIDELEKKFEVVEDSMVDKISAMESDVDDLNASFQGITASIKADIEKKMETLRKEFEKRDLAMDKNADLLSKTLQKDIDGRFSALAANTSTQIKQIAAETTSLRKEVDSFTVNLSQKFDSIIKEKSRDFETMVSAVSADAKAKEREINIAISDFKKEIQKTEVQKRTEVDKTLKEFIAEKGKIDEKLKQIDIKIAELSEMRKELKKEIYKESLSGVNERVKDIVEGIGERFENARDDTDTKINELMKTVDMRVREVEANLSQFKVELGKTIGKLTSDVDKATGKKTGEVDKVVEKLKADVEQRVKATISDISDNLDMIKSDLSFAKAEFEKRLSSIKKDFDTSEARRLEKTEKAKKDTDALIESLKVKFQAGERERWIETNKSLKELMAVKGEIGRRLNDLDGETKKFYDIKDSIKNEVMKESTSLIDNKLLAFSKDKKGDISETKKSLRTEVVELQMVLEKLSEKIERLGGKIEAVRDDVYTVKKARTLVIENVKSINRAVEDNVDLKLRDFMKDLEKRMKTQESVLNIRIGETEKKIDSVAESITKTKKEKEEELEELLRHVES